MNENTCHFVFASVVTKTQTFLNQKKKKNNTKHLNYIKLVCHAIIEILIFAT